MSEAYVSKALRERVAVADKRRCGYCLTSEAVVRTPMEIDHIVPQSFGGRTEVENLWLACPLCNNHKGSRITGLDPLTGEIVRLFHPRHQVWSEHFAWSATGDLIVGLTPTGRATVAALNLNRPALLKARQAWMTVGWHPPRQ